MADFAVSTKFTALDRVTKAFGRMSKGADRFGDRTDRAFRKASRSGSRFGDIVKGVLTANIISRGFGLLARGLREVTTQFISLDDAIVSAAAKFSDINLRTDEGRKRMNALRDAARAVGGATQFTATEAGQGLDFLALAGFTATQAMQLLPPVTDLATVAQIDLARATDIASDALGAFGLMTKDSVQLQKNFTRINDVMALTMASTNTGIEDMFEALKAGAPVFTTAGQSVETFNALLGIMANSGIKGARAGTVLKNLITRLADPSGEAAKALATLNVQVADSSGNFRDMLDILGDVNKGLVGFGTKDTAKFLSQIFGLRAIAGVGTLLTAGIDSVVAFRQELLDAGGASAEMAAFMRTSLGNVIKTLTSAALEKAFAIFDVFRKRGQNVIGALIGGVRAIDVVPIVNVLEDLFVVIGNIRMALTPVVQLFGPLFVGGIKAVSGALADMSNFLPAIIGGLIAWRAGLVGVAIWQAVVIGTNPIGLIAIGIGVLVAGIILLIENLDKVKAAWRITWTFIKQSFAESVNAIVGGFFLLFKAPLLLARLVAQALGQSTASLFISGLLSDVDAARRKLTLSVPGQSPLDFLGLAGATPTAPNLADVLSRREVTLSGLIEIFGAPPGSTANIETTGPGTIDTALVGLNP